MSQAAAAAFDAESVVYDEGFGRNAVGRLFRGCFQQRLAALFAPGARVVEIGCGTGDDALFLAARGVRVHATDVAAGMLARARAKVEARALGAPLVTFEQRAAEDVGGVDGAPFDGAYSDFGALNCVDLEAFGRGLTTALAPGAPVLFSVMGAHPLPALLLHALTGRGRPRGGRTPRVGGIDVPTHYPSPARFRRALGPGFAWRGVAALGVLVPDPRFAPRLERRPRLLAALAAVEARVRAWPGLRALGDHLVYEGARR
jgi:SAM-dependent methyltransferase